MGSHERPPAANVQPSLEAVETLLKKLPENGPNVVPLLASLPADLVTPTVAYLKISDGGKAAFSFLFESAATTETIGRYSFVGASKPNISRKQKVILTGYRSKEGFEDRTWPRPIRRSSTHVGKGVGPISRGLHTIVKAAFDGRWCYWICR